MRFDVDHEWGEGIRAHARAEQEPDDAQRLLHLMIAYGHFQTVASYAGEPRRRIAADKTWEILDEVDKMCGFARKENSARKSLLML